MRKRVRQAILGAVVAFCGALLMGACRTWTTPSFRTAGIQAGSVTNQVLITIGKVCRARHELGYVVVECVSLPLADEEATVYREDQAVARVRLTGPSRMPFVAADIIEGLPEVGDKVRAKRTRITSKNESGLP